MSQNYDFYRGNKDFENQWLPNHIRDASPLKKKILLAIYMRRFRDSNWFMTTAGYPGTGKSWALLKLFWELQVDPKTLERNFDPETQVVFTGMDFIKQVRNTDPDTDPGRCILFDEIEIEANSKGWDKVGQQIALAVNTMRFKKNILGASLPRETDLLKGVRSLRNARVITKDIDFTKNQIVGKYMFLNYHLYSDTHDSQSKNAAYSMYPRMDIKDKENNNISVKIDEIRFGKPPKYIIKKYQAKKKAYLNEFYDKQLDFFKQQERKKNGGLGFEEAYEYMKNNEERLGVRAIGKVDPVLLANDLQLSKTEAKEFANTYMVKKKIQQQRGNTAYD
jgi:hypothetical protein